MVPTPVVEDYLQAIHYMSRDGEHVIAARLAEWMDVTPATVAATLKRMVKQRLVVMDRSKTIGLTDEGQQRAESIVRRHALAEWLLTKLLGLPWHEANEYAHRLEHAITDKVEERLSEVLNHPVTCPHGNPLPGQPVHPKEVGLDTRATGERVTVQRITEEAEQSHELLEFLQRHGVVPGAQMVVEEAAPYNGIVMVRRNGETFPLGNSAAAKVRVLPD